MFLGDKSLFVVLWIVRLAAPILARYLKTKGFEVEGLFQNGEKNALIGLLEAVNADDKKAKEAMKHAEVEIKQIQEGE